MVNARRFVRVLFRNFAHLTTLVGPRIKATVTLLVASVFLSTCSANPVPDRPDRNESSTPSPSASGSAPDTAVKPPGPCEAQNGGKQSHMQLVRLEVSPHGDEDWVVFEFDPVSGPSDAPPTFELSSVSPPFTEDPSDEPMQVDGEEFFQLIFHGASGVKMEGETPKKTYTGPSELKPEGNVVQEVEQQGDFEATLSWIIGLSLHSCPSVSQLADPPRLVLRFPR